MTGIRPMVPADAAPLGHMHHQAWLEAFGHLLPQSYWDRWTVTDAVTTWDEILHRPPSGVRRVVATEPSGSIVGFAVAGPTRPKDLPEPITRPVELRALYVLRSRYGTGLGQSLLDAVLDGETAAELWVFQDNGRAQAFYRRNGFTPDGAEYVDERFPELLEIRMVR